MTIKTAFAALGLIILPAASFAEFGCSERGHQAQSCKAGTVWDASLQTCVKQVSS